MTTLTKLLSHNSKLAEMLRAIMHPAVETCEKIFISDRNSEAWDTGLVEWLMANTTWVNAKGGFWAFLEK